MRSTYILVLEKIIKFLQLQLFISLLSFPLIAAWGLPISIASLAGNFIFTPCVILFVAISTGIFFTELVGIPNTVLITFLEYVTRGWYYCLAWGKKSWVIGIPYELIPFTIILAIIALLIICHKRWGQLLESTGLLFMLYLSFFVAWYFVTPSINFVIVTKGKAMLSLVSGKDGVFLYDNDYLRRIKSDSWVEYTLLPMLTTQTGMIVIDTLWLNTFSPKAMPVISEMMDYAIIHTVILPYFEGSLTYDQWKDFFKMYSKAEELGVCIKRSGHHIQKTTLFNLKGTNSILYDKKLKTVSFS